MERIWMKYWPKNVSETLVYRNGEKPLHEYLRDHASMFGSHPAYIFYGNEISWHDINWNSDKLGAYFQQKGVQKGDRIGLFMQNCPQYIISHYAIQKIGAIVVPLNPMYKKDELDYMANEIGMKGIVCGQELYPVVDAVRENSSIEFVVMTNYADLLPKQPTLPLPDELKVKKVQMDHTDDMLTILEKNDGEIRPVPLDIWEDVALMVFTSGTTGRPKAAMLTYGNALFKTAASFHANGLSEKDRSLAVAPLCHIAGMVMGVNLPVYSGATSILLTRFDPEAVISAIETYQCRAWYSVAPMNVAILNQPGVEERDLSSLQKNLATSFGMPVSEELANQWEKITGGCKLYEASYGLSETHTCDTFMPPDNVRFGSCGIPMYDTDIRIVDLDSGEDLPPGQEGEIVIKNPGVFKGYWNRPESTKETLRDGWVFTGDVGLISEEGYLYFNGRIKEMIKSSGYSVFPEEVESLMMDHEAVAQVAAIGVSDETRGESVKAVIVLKEGYKGKVSENELITWAREKMAAYKYPRMIEFRDSLPATSSGKVLRRLLKDETLKGGNRS